MSFAKVVSILFTGFYSAQPEFSSKGPNKQSNHNDCRFL